ncbi:hypothetical protein KC343_g316 [Hortaea werneckii]|nr:hypothetical protein KC352_g2800 [Hortaea werneckii]KAI7572649.1 hypothetical protein KC317_g560 [Hortaea werneckii]KAI7628213.1 hypothetical protein KC346_g318 [Hortaea werneckii]KAI7638083.1 hypothetical protein KC343_g316 [Hortaea werneckii]KAI7683492.1 hypothetical protein KC319_g421 [Hortaea werneckii]
MSSSSSQLSGSDTDQYELSDNEYEISDDLRSIPVLWTLVVSRRSPTGRKHDELLKDDFSAQASPFDLESITQERTPQPPSGNDKVTIASSGNVIEIATNVFDPRRRPRGRAKRRHTMLPIGELSKELRSCQTLGLSVTLRSSLLRSALRSMIEYYPKHGPSSFDNVITIEEPFSILIHHFSKINECADSEENLDHCGGAAHGVVRAHMAILRDFLKPRNSMYLEGLQKNPNGHMHCFYDGPDIENGGRYRGKIVIDHENSEIDVDNCFVPADDGFARFAKYNNIRLRDQPPIIPKVRRNSQRGRAYTRPKTYSRQRSPTSPASFSSSSENSQPATPNAQSGEEPLYEQKPGPTEMTDHQKLLIWPQAPAFALGTKKWMTISLGHVNRVERSDDSIKNLQLDPSAAQIIKALSMQQDQSGDSWGADFIEGKGAGQIILLHGPPGVGKTYTVEGISEWLRRPLISLSVADIGTTETRVEQELMKWFDLAEAWNAVLLVDEADIFLEQRKNRDLSRNGLVSAFLRRMEYFRGLLFLTTNRVGQIDDAFVSRVHMAIGYERLSPDFRRKIWEGFFRKLERERAGKILVGPSARKFVLHSDEVQKIELNGREIRNALQTAITLAEFESIEAAGDSGEGGATPSSSQIVVVEEDHFRRVLKMSEKFHDYVTAIRREDEIQRAKVRGDRDDYAKVGAADGRSK